MTKKGLFATSLVAALPAFGLGVLMMWAILGNLDKMPMILQVVAIVTLIASAVMAFFPLYILGFYGRASTPKAPKKAAEKKDDKAADPKTLVAKKEAAPESADELDAADDFEPAGDFEAASDDNFEFEDFAEDDKK